MSLLSLLMVTDSGWYMMVHIYFSINLNFVRLVPEPSNGGTPNLKRNGLMKVLPTFIIYAFSTIAYAIIDGVQIRTCNYTYSTLWSVFVPQTEC